MNNRHTKIYLLLLLTCIACASAFLLNPISQDQSYHNFADKRTFLSIPNFLNVWSNIFFVLVGIAGLFSLSKSKARSTINICYAALFIGILFTGLGSAYYHYLPNNNTLVFDRLPMTFVFMALLSSTIAEHINFKAGILLLLPLLVTGNISIWWWHYTESTGKGDLRLYGLVQFYPMLFIPIILSLFPVPAYNKGTKQLIWVVIWYGVAKTCEHFDEQIYACTNIISGHSLKHITAAIATWYLVKMFRKNYIIANKD